MDYPLEPGTAIDRISGFINSQVRESDADKLLVGLSGGIDSSVTSALTVEAMDPDMVHGLILPGGPTGDEDIDHAENHAESFGIDYDVLEIESATQEIEEISNIESPGKVATGNIRARVRMILLYHYSNQLNGLVMGTGNRTEYLLGYFTKHGDGATDIGPITGLYKTEVRSVARKLGVSEEIIEKPPSAGLWQGQTDEEEIGAKYSDIDPFLVEYIDRDESLQDAANKAGMDIETATEIEGMIKASSHKRQPTPIVDFGRS